METTTNERTLTDVLKEKVAKKVEQNQARVQTNLIKFEDISNNLNDYIVNVGKHSAESNVSFTSNGKVYMNIQGLREMEKPLVFGMHPHAITQAGEKFRINQSYISRLAVGQDWEKRLAATILNEHTTYEERQRVLLREVKGEVRGVLSDHYRRMNSKQIIGTFLTAIREQGAMILDAFTDDTRSWIEVIHTEIIEVPTANNGIVSMVFGMRIGNSDFGDGALDLRMFSMQGVCMNGMVRETVLRQIHLGGKIPDNLHISDKTFDLDTKTQASLVNDMVLQCLSPASIKREAELIQNASLIHINPKQELVKLQKVGVSKDEVVKIEAALMENKIEDGVQGESTLWKMSQAVSAVSREAQDRRKRELEEVAGQLIDRANKQTTDKK